MALLMSREQGERVAQELDLGRKNVLVLGQPACIVYTPLQPLLRVRRQKLKTPKAHSRPATTTTAITTPMM